MFFGEYDHSLDDKGRVFIPAKFRRDFEGGAFVTKEIDGCLSMYTREEFTRVAEDLQDKSTRGPLERNVARTRAAGTAELTLDKQGRVAIPANLRTFAGLGREVVVTGALNRLEIWDSGRWRAINEVADQALVNASAGLDDVGV